jgi:hypothetical protein
LKAADMKILTGILIAIAIVVAVVVLILFDTTGWKGSGLGKEFEYDVKKLAKIDPNLILYEESAQPIRTGFANSRGIAVDSKGWIYVAGDRTIRIFAEGGNLLAEITLSDKPGCLAVAGDGKMYVAFKRYVEVYDEGGKRLAVWQSLGDDAVLTSIAVVKNDVFVADAGNRIVLHYDINGKLINRIGEKNKGKNIAGFVIPSPYFDLAIGSDGLLRVVNPGHHRIEAYTFGGDLEFWWGKFSSDVDGFIGCCNPVNFAILEDGSFVTCEKGLTRVKVYDPEGNFVGVVAGPEQLLKEGTFHICDTAAECQTGGFDVAVGPQGQALVLDTTNNTVRTFTKKKAR